MTRLRTLNMADCVYCNTLGYNVIADLAGEPNGFDSEIQRLWLAYHRAARRHRSDGG